MNGFGEVFGKCLDEAGISQIAAAEAAECSRAMIYSVINGEKMLSENKFQTMVRELAFSDMQMENLRRSYYESKYPDGVIDKIYRIREYLREDETDDKKNFDGVEPYLPDKTCTIRGLSLLCRTIIGIVYGSKAKIITNYPFSNTDADNAFFSALSAADEDMDFIHIVEFEADNKSPRNIDNLFKSIRYIRKKYVPLMYYGNSGDGIGSELLPYFIVSDKYAAFFDADFSMAVFSNEETIVNGVFVLAEKIVGKCKYIGMLNDNIFDMKNFVQCADVAGTVSSMSNFTFFLPYASVDILKSIAPPNLDPANRDILVELILNHYKGCAGGKMKRMMSVQGLETFAREGIIADFPKSMTVPMPCKYRIEVLETILQQCEQSPESCVFLDNTVLNVPDECFGIILFHNNFQICGSLPNSDTFVGQYVITDKNKNIQRDFKYFMDFIVRNRLYIPFEQIKLRINDLILECRRMQEQGV
ncbi:MAG: helix-turn-helix transcriptional regulator [Clostridiales bacterium]|nr:helix-turn-helix transcriptional regulator [Clostridiales bacterium]